MSKVNKFIETIQMDEEQMILIQVKSAYQKYLRHDKANRAIRKILVETLRNDLISIFIEATSVRIKVAAGKEQESIKKIEEQIEKQLGNPFKLIKLIR